ncbi:MAG: hypothetical protein ISS56_08890 [Anaerolineae bacterium]|nr:hypothetical protein [Anaerolineae bacterium]
MRTTRELFQPKHRGKVIAALILCLLVLLGSATLVSWTQRGFGAVEVSNLTNAMLVAWMFASSQVIAPLPI